jgi:hypothetical protein
MNSLTTHLKDAMSLYGFMAFFFAFGSKNEVSGIT